MQVSFDSLIDSPLPEVAWLMTESFAGYFVEIHMEAAGIAGMVRCESLDLASSICVRVNCEEAGLALINRRGWTCRLGAMAVRPDFRGKGLGRKVLEKAIEDATGRGERRMVLEVIEANSAARALYTSA